MSEGMKHNEAIPQFSRKHVAALEKEVKSLKELCHMQSSSVLILQSQVERVEAQAGEIRQQNRQLSSSMVKCLLAVDVLVKKGIISNDELEKEIQQATDAAKKRAEESAARLAAGPDAGQGSGDVESGGAVGSAVSGSADSDPSKPDDAGTPSEGPAATV